RWPSRVCIIEAPAVWTGDPACYATEEITMSTSHPRFGHELIATVLATIIATLSASQTALAQSAPAASKPPSAAEVQSRQAAGGYRPDRMQNPNLTGNPPKLTVTPLEEIPLDK